MLEYGLCCKLHWVRYRMKKWSIEGMNIAMLVEKSEWDSGPEPHSSKHPWPTACPVCQGGSLRELQQWEMVKSMPGPQPQYHMLFLKWHPFCVCGPKLLQCPIMCLSLPVHSCNGSPTITPTACGVCDKEQILNCVCGGIWCLYSLAQMPNRYLLIRIILVLSLFIVVVYLR